MKNLNEQELDKINGGLTSTECCNAKNGDHFYLVLNNEKVAKVRYEGQTYDFGLFYEMRMQVYVVEIYQDFEEPDNDYHFHPNVGDAFYVARSYLQKI